MQKKKEKKEKTQPGFTQQCYNINYHTSTVYKGINAFKRKQRTNVNMQAYTHTPHK